MSWSPSRSYFPPQPLKPKPCARRSLPLPRTIGPVSRSQMSPNGSTMTSAKGASARALSAAPSWAATSQTCSPLPPAWTASAKAATSRSAGFRSPSHSSGSLGKPIHTASCGAHSGSGGEACGRTSAPALTGRASVEVAKSTLAVPRKSRNIEAPREGGFMLRSNVAARCGDGRCAGRASAAAQAAAATDAAGVRRARERDVASICRQTASRSPTSRPAPGRSRTVGFVADLQTGQSKPFLTHRRASDRLGWCKFADRPAPDLPILLRSATMPAMLVGFSRLVAVNGDGSELKELGQQRSFYDADSPVRWQHHRLAAAGRRRIGADGSRLYSRSGQVGQPLGARRRTALGVDRARHAAR